GDRRGSLCSYDTPSTATYTLSLHDALPICPAGGGQRAGCLRQRPVPSFHGGHRLEGQRRAGGGHPDHGPHPSPRLPVRGGGEGRSEEHTSELQSRENLVCRLLLEKKKNDSQ